jgi:hypothetical protein
MEVKDILAAALREIEEAKVPDELRPVAFGKVVDLLAAGTQPAPRGRPRIDHGGDESESILDRIAAQLEASPESVAVVYYEQDGDLGIGVAHTKLASGKASATRQLALVVAAGRQAAGLDDGWTNVGTIRRWCEEFGKFDSPNFAATIREIGEVFSFRGQGQRREIRVLRPGFEKARQLVEELAAT